MARSLPKLVLITLLFPLTIFAARSQPSARSLSIEAGPRRSERLSHLHFYLHEVILSLTTTQSTTSFGTIFAIDDMLKLGPDVGSKLVGRAQGPTSSASQAKLTLLMAVNLVFTEGQLQWEHFGCPLSMLGRNSLALEVREMLVRGYVRTKTRSIDRTSGILVSEYDIYILHY
ncbi:hypothetical protein ACJRO7_002493 [Eucalyptus globulus]|uniref:Dirigent protein n=1 Tax=Eucalyptus globulus TaxID=34317 RepID=A0ABD3LVM1_EUCGL